MSTKTVYYARPLVIVAMLLSSSLVLANEINQPNIVLLFADDLGYGELGCQGNKQIPTPHIDSIARNGVRFTNGYVTAAYCSASRAGIMTGRYQTRFGYSSIRSVPIMNTPMPGCLYQRSPSRSTFAMSATRPR